MTRCWYLIFIVHLYLTFNFEWDIASFINGVRRMDLVNYGEQERNKHSATYAHNRNQTLLEYFPKWYILFLERAYAGLFQEPILIFGHIIQSSKFQLVFDSS